MRLAVVSLLCSLATPVAAQTPILPTALDSGRFVRLHTPSGKLVGRLTSPFRNTDPVVHFCRYPGPPCQSADDSTGIRSTDTASLLRLEVSQGSRWKKGATIGGVVGLVFGGLGALFLGGFCESDCPSATSLVITGGVGTGLVYGAIGAIWGSSFPRWEETP